MFIQVLKKEKKKFTEHLQVYALTQASLCHRQIHKKHMHKKGIQTTLMNPCIILSNKLLSQNRQFTLNYLPSKSRTRVIDFPFEASFGNGLG